MHLVTPVNAGLVEEMVVDQLEVELVRENPGQVHPEQALRRHFDAAIRPTAAIVKEGHGRPAGSLDFTPTQPWLFT